MNELLPEKKQAPRPVREGLYRGGQLIAGRSRASGRVFFPKPLKDFQTNTDTISEFVLGSECKLFSFTTVHMKTLHFDPPYSIGYVDFPEGVRVFGPIAGNGHDLKIGMKLKVEIAPLWTEEDGTPILGHRFVPVD